MLSGSFSNHAGEQFVVPVITVHFVIMLLAACKVSSLCQVQSVLRNECHCWERLENKERNWQIMSGLHVDTSVCITCSAGSSVCLQPHSADRCFIHMKTGSALLDKLAVSWKTASELVRLHREFPNPATHIELKTGQASRWESRVQHYTEKHLNSSEWKHFNSGFNSTINSQLIL